MQLRSDLHIFVHRQALSTSNQPLHVLIPEGSVSKDLCVELSARRAHVPHEGSASMSRMQSIPATRQRHEVEPLVEVGVLTAASSDFL